MARRDEYEVEKPDSERGEIAEWLQELDAARKREEPYRKECAKILRLYANEDKTDYTYNILYANVDTLTPALYNATPRPVVKRRYPGNADPVAMKAAEAGQRILQFLIDTGSEETSDFDDLMALNVHEGVLTSRGVSRFCYTSKIEKVHGGGGEASEDQDFERLEDELVSGEAISWNRMLYGYAKRWVDTPWEAFIHYMDRDELIGNFGEEKGKKVKLDVAEDNDNGGKDGEEPPRDANIKFALVYEIYDKKTRKVIFLSPGLPDQFLDKRPDPHGLQGFFPNPQPLGFVLNTVDTTPIPLYRMYSEQARELNNINTRINYLVRALKVRGAYDGTAKGLKEVLEAKDNEFLPVDNLAQLTAGNLKSLEAAIWMFPIDSIIQAINQLYLARSSCLQVIYEITGLADIMRGASNAGETLGAQELKNQWGTLRLKKSQKRVMKYVRSCLRIMLEMTVNKIQEETAEKMTGMGLMTTLQKQQSQVAVQQAQAMGQQVPPQILEEVQKPSWGEVLEVLKSDLQRNFRIDIETNSTIDAEATEDKQDIAELLNAISQFLNGIAPLVEQGYMPFEVVKGMLLNITRRFRLGDEFEEQLAKMAQPAPKPDPKVEAAQAKAKADQEKHAMDMQAKQADMAMKQQEMRLELQKMQMELQLDRERLALERQKMQMDMQAAQASNVAQMEMLQAKVAAAHAMPKKPAQQQGAKQ